MLSMGTWPFDWARYSAAILNVGQGCKSKCQPSAKSTRLTGSYLNELSVEISIGFWCSARMISLPSLGRFVDVGEGVELYE